MIVTYKYKGNTNVVNTQKIILLSDSLISSVYNFQKTQLGEKTIAQNKYVMIEVNRTSYLSRNLVNDIVIPSKISHNGLIQEEGEYSNVNQHNIYSSKVFFSNSLFYFESNSLVSHRCSNY